MHRRLVVTFTYEGEEYTAQSKDLSKGGALFTAPIAPPVGTKFLLNLSDRKRPELEMFLKVMVVRVHSGPNGEPLFGVEFGDVVSRDPTRVRAFLERVLGVEAGLIRVEAGEGEKSYVFSFDPIHQEGQERLRALQSSLFESIEEMEEADAILSNFGKMPSAAELEAGAGNAPSDVRITRVDDAPAEGGRGQKPAAGQSTDGAVAPAMPQGGTSSTSRETPVRKEPARPPSEVPANRPEAANAVDSGRSAHGAGAAPPPKAAEQRTTSKWPPPAPSASSAGGLPDMEELPLDAVGDLAVPPVEPPPEPLPPPPHEEKKPRFSLFGTLFGSKQKRGESLIQTQPIPTVVARNLDIPVVYRLGTSRFQGIATRLYCAGLKIRTDQQLPALYASVLIVIPLAGARKISQIEVQGDVTRVRAEQAGSDQKGIFEVRLSMRTDKMHLELYRALLERLIGQTG